MGRPLSETFLTHLLDRWGVPRRGELADHLFPELGDVAAAEGEGHGPDDGGAPGGLAVLLEVSRGRHAQQQTPKHDLLERELVEAPLGEILELALEQEL